MYWAALLGGLITTVALSKPAIGFAFFATLVTAYWLMLMVATLLLLERLVGIAKAAPIGGVLAGLVVITWRQDVEPLLAVLLFGGPILAAGVLITAGTKQLFSGAHVASAVALFVGPQFALPATIPLADRVLHDDFVELADEVRAGQGPTSETFRVGPYTYDGLCGHGDGTVMIWDSSALFMKGPAIVITADDEISRATLGENSSWWFDCDRRRVSRR